MRRRRLRAVPIRGSREWPRDDGKDAFGSTVNHVSYYCAETGCTYTRKAPWHAELRCPVHRVPLRSAGAKGLRWVRR